MQSGVAVGQAADAERYVACAKSDKTGSSKSERRRILNEKEFRMKAQAEGFTEPEIHEVNYAPAKEMHTHDHTVLSLVLRGEFTMIFENESKTYGPGDWCVNPSGTLHTEQIGPDGVVALVAKK